MSTTNPCAKKVTPEEAYEVWQTLSGDTIHWVLKKYKAEHVELADPFARWSVATTSPGTSGSYEYGDAYARTIKASCLRRDNPLCQYVCVRLDDETTISQTQLETYRSTPMRTKDIQLADYIRVAVPKNKLTVFKQIAEAHKLTLVAIDADDEVHDCRLDLEHERIRRSGEEQAGC